MSLRDSKIYKQKSAERLKRVMKKKVQTTMIGAISSVENLFDFLWEEQSEQSEKMRELFNALRSEILDKGNHQIRNIDTEIEMYDISLKTHTVKLPVRQTGGNNE
tara:strand:- start:235 stop:549 length:315 start_codon:yes stop_codon:yes gene_type:complete